MEISRCEAGVWRGRPRPRIRILISPLKRAQGLLDDSGPGVISHIWVTIASADPHHLKALVLRMYWDGETSPSVETPIGDFFGLGLGDYFLYQSIPLSVGSDKALNCFFPMPFQKHAKITVTNEGAEKVSSFYFNIDYRAYSKRWPRTHFTFTRSIARPHPPAVGPTTGAPTATRLSTRRRTSTARATTSGWKPRDAATSPV